MIYRIGIPLVLGTLLSACTLNEGDPKTTLCQKLTAHLMSENYDSVVWQAPSSVEKPDEHLLLTVRYSKEGSDNITQATCLYPHHNDQNGEDYEVMPDDYENTPDKMSINGSAVRLSDLHRAIQRVTGQAVKDTFNEENIRKKAAELDQSIQEGARQLDESIQRGTEKLGESLEKVGEKLQNKD